MATCLCDAFYDDVAAAMQGILAAVRDGLGAEQR